MPSPVRPHRHRRGLAALAASAAAVTMVLALLPTPGSAAPSAPALAALDWQTAQLAANGGTMPGFVPGSPEWGLTADAVLAYVAAGQATNPAAVTATDAVAANAATYTTWAPTMPEVRVAGASGKVLLVLLSMGRSATVDGIDLEAEVRSLMVTTGAEAGRFSDRVPDPTWNAANGFGQALSMLALSMTPGGVPDTAVTFALAQQCPAGGFRLTVGATATCTADGDADTDTTALMVQALLPVTRTAAVAAGLDRAVAWLLSKQDAASGAFGGSGPTAAPNSNSSGLVAQALRAAGATDAADRAAAWITANQLAGVGAIAYNPAALADGQASGITEQTGDQWRRSTAQAALGLGLAPYGKQGSTPVTTTPTSSTTSTSSSTTSSTSPTTTITATTSTVPATTTTTSVVRSTTTAVVAVESANQTADRRSNRSPGQTSGASLAATGNDARTPLIAGSAALLVGAALLVVRRRS